ncbi:MAG: Ppx/GppA family phosphatase, partial [Pedosphaera parvula]|nr:Ppx/GppA family phosphatase [Pedosphaera parvula]
MNTERRAVIDIGTNSIKLLVADVTGRRVEPLLERSRQTRLGSGFYETHQLQPDAIARTVRAVAEFAGQARHHHPVFTRVIATSATRDALNAGELTSAIEEIAGHKVEIISGEQEADWVFQGVSSEPEFAGRPLLILDVGGGSSEFILGEDSAKHFRQSYRLGTVRLLELLKPGDPPAAGDLARCRDWLAAFLRREIEPGLAPVLQSPERTGGVQLVGTGGTPGILIRMQLELADYDRGRMEGARMSLD